jgi:hypothetical protein
MGIVRAQEGTQAQQSPAGSRIEIRVTAASVTDAVVDGVTPVSTALTALTARVTTAESDIDALQAADIALDARLDTAESDIDALQAFDTALATSSGSASVGFLQAGTGAVLRTVQSKLRDVVSVFDFMTTAQIADVKAGTALINVTAAIQAAINAASPGASGSPAGTVYFPRGSYLITSPLNLTADNGAANRRGVRLLGETAGSGDYVYGTKIIGQTNGKAIVEIVDNDNCQIENLTLTNSATNGATVGIYQARRTGGTSPSLWSGNCYYKNVTISFTNDSISTNNNFGTIGIINIAGEETTYDRCEVWANLPLAISWQNTLRKAVNALTATTYDSFEYNPVHCTQADITEGYSNTVFRTKNCRLIAKGWNAPIVLLQEVGSYFAYGDFTQKRDSTTGPNGTNGIGYELWNAYQITLDATTEQVRTPLLMHRDVNTLRANLRGVDGGVGAAAGLLHFGIDAPAFEFMNASVDIDYVGTISYGLITYTTPAGVGALEPAQVTLKNCKFRLNKTSTVGIIDTKILYKSINTTYEFSDTSLYVSERFMRFPLVSKSIGAPATTTNILNIAFPSVITNLSGFSATVRAFLHVSNAEFESAGVPSSAAVTATWQISRDPTPGAVVITTATTEILTSSTIAGGNNITGLTLSSVLTGFTSAVLRVASIQTGINLADAAISGYVEITYAGGYSTAPVVSVL